MLRCCRPNLPWCRGRVMALRDVHQYTSHQYYSTIFRYMSHYRNPVYVALLPLNLPWCRGRLMDHCDVHQSSVLVLYSGTCRTQITVLFRGQISSFFTTIYLY